MTLAGDEGRVPAEGARVQERLTLAGATFTARPGRTAVVCGPGRPLTLATHLEVEQKQFELIRRLVTVEDVEVLEELGRVLDTAQGPSALRRLDDAEIEAVLRQLLEE